MSEAGDEELSFSSRNPELLLPAVQYLRAVHVRPEFGYSPAGGRVFLVLDQVQALGSQPFQVGEHRVDGVGAVPVPVVHLADDKKRMPRSV